MSETIEEHDWTISEERKAQLDSDKKRLHIEHSVSLHRDEQSIRDLRQMLELLVKAGAPEDATVHVQNTSESFTGGGHLRLYSRWKKAPNDH